MTQEMLEKAKQAKSAEELLALAKENGIELTDERAREVFNSLYSSAELADEELDNVAGGGCGLKTCCPRCGKSSSSWKLVDFTTYQCPNCGARIDAGTEDPFDHTGIG